MRIMKILNSVFVILALLFSSGCAANEAQGVRKVLQQKEPIVGVVFEIVGGDSDSLQRAIKRIKTYSEQLHQVHADLLITVVTHGYEQFTLTKAKDAEHPELHQQVQSIVKDDRIAIEVCGTFADMMEVAHDEFPDYVDVVPQGPAQIQSYEHEGYVIIQIDLSL